jgi:hypothetical protein
VSVERAVLTASPELWAAAQRCADEMNAHIAVYREHLKQGRERPGFVAIRLSDGRSPDHVLYDTRRDATRHQPPYPDGMMYVKVQPRDMTPRMALTILKAHRYAFERGVVFTEEEIVMPHRLEDIAQMIPTTFLANPWRMR